MQIKLLVRVGLAGALALALTGGTAFADTGAAPQAAEGAATSDAHADPKALPLAAPKSAAPVNGWTLDNPVGGEALESGGGWTHFKSSSRNGNSATGTSLPAMAVYGSPFNFSQAGSLHATLKTTQAAGNNRFGFYLGYTDPGNGLFIGFDSAGWFWQKYAGGDGDYYSGSRIAAPATNVATDVEVSWNGTTATLNVDGAKAFDVDYSSMTALSGKVAMKAGTYGSSLTDMYIKDFPETDKSTYAVSGTVVDAQGPVEGVKVRVAGASSAVTDVGGAFTIQGLKNGTYTLSVGKIGYIDLTQTITVQGEDVTLPAITIMAGAGAEPSTQTLRTDEMQVRVKDNFPSVLDYTMTKLGNRKMYGQPTDVRVVNINGTDVTLGDHDVTVTKVGNTLVRYLLRVNNAGAHINAQLTADMSVKANTLSLDVTKIVNNLDERKYPIQTVSFPGQSLVSVQSNQDGAQFTGARMSSNTNKNGDTTFPVTDTTAISDAGDYIYGFVSGGSLSAGLWSNSEHDGTTVEAVAGGAQNTRVVASTVSFGGETSLGLSSAPWYYHRVVTDSKKKSYTDDQLEMPKLKVAIAGDENNDGAVNWEDGALSYRSIMNNPTKSEEVPDLVSYRVAMNFGSQAQNPFLTTLDNVKKVALNTDGLGQSVLLKGYANEGHDSGHPDYGDIGQRIGGAKDMNTLLEKGSKYGARFGVHVNAGEMYPEAKAFNDDLVRRNADGSLHYGWNWLDQAVGIDSIYDLNHGRAERFQDLKDKVGDNLDFVYVDIWGNQTGGSDDSWQTRRLSHEINSRGWRMANEWGAANEYDATFQHWAADLTYGDSTLKGENSQVMRFLRNHQKDSWDGDYPSYGGAANAPLLGGYSMKDFEGWQGRNDYADYIDNLYTHDVSTKFLQHFKVQRWVNGPLDASSVRDRATNNGNEQIVLNDDDGNVVVVSRKSNDAASPDYRQRTITFNGQVVLNGAVKAGDGSSQGDESYLLPWIWNAKSGKRESAANQRLYHWNTVGGKTTWTLPNGWSNLANVKVYRLTDQGRTDMQTIPVSGGKVTLNALAETPYVVYQGEQNQMQVKWSDGMHVVDAGFNGEQNTLASNWKTSLSQQSAGKAEIVGTNNAMLRLSGTASVSQNITGLTAGKRYALYVGVDKRGGGKASVSVDNDGAQLASNYTDASIARNYVKAYAHNTDTNTEGGESLFQNMYVWFVAPSRGSTRVTLSQSGTGNAEDHAYFDDVRILENGYDGLSLNKDGTLQELTNDFERNAQGMWPFVESGLEGVEDNRTHLSELHAPYTQAGWDVKKMDDVLGGKWSVKINGLCTYDYLVYQTIPQTVRLEPGERYEVSFDYQSGSDDIYAFTTGDGPYDASRDASTPLKRALGTTAHAKFTVTGAPRGDTWFGISSTDKEPNLQGATGSAEDFGGYKDFVLDNLSVKHIAAGTRTKAEADAKLKEITDKYAGGQSQCRDDDWKLFEETLVKAKVLINKDGANSGSYAKAYDVLVSLDAFMHNAPDNADSDAYDVAYDGGNGYGVEAGSEQTLSSGGTEGPAALAQDGDATTHWHTKWGANEVAAGNAWYQFDLAQPTTITGLRYLPRATGANGRIEQFNIDVATDGDTQMVGPQSATPSHRVITGGTFLTDAKWQKVMFDAPIEHVTAIRITATQTDGSSDGDKNSYASAAELRVTTDQSIRPAQTTVDKSLLANDIGIAEALNEADYTPVSWAPFSRVLTKAEEVNASQDSSLYDVELSRANLESAIDGLARVQEGTADSGTWATPSASVVSRPNVGRQGSGPQHAGSGTADTLSNTGSTAVAIVVVAALMTVVAAVFVAIARRLKE